MVENIGGKNIGEISFLDYLEGKTLADRLQIKYEYWIICKFEGENFGNWPSICQIPNVFSHQHFCYTVYGTSMRSMNPSISFSTETA